MPMRFAIFHSTCLKYCTRHEKVKPGAAPVLQHHLSKPEDLMLQNATSLSKSAPWPSQGVSCTAPARRNASLQILFKCPACHRFRDCRKTPTFCSLFGRAQNPLRLPRKMTIGHRKLIQTHGVKSILTSKGASRHNGMQFSISSTSKSGPSMVWFWHSDFELCFVPQSRALFPHLNFQT